MNTHELKECRPSWAEPRRGQSPATQPPQVRGQNWLVALCLLFSICLSALPVLADPPKPYAENLTLPAGLVYLPGDLGGHMWVSDHLLGLCRLDANPSGAVPPFSVNQLTCVAAPTLTSAGQTAFAPHPTDPTSGFLYVPDNGSKGQGVTRLTFNKTTETLGDPVLLPISAAQVPTGPSRAQAVALGPDGNLYAVYGRSNVIDRITNPSGLDGSPTTADSIGFILDRKGPPSITFVGPDLYLAEAIGVTKIPNAASDTDHGGCAPGCQAVSELNLGGAPTFVTSNGSDTLYIASLTGVVRATFFTVDCPSSYIPDMYVSTATFPFENISALGLKNNVLYVGDDRTAGQLVLTGRVWEALSGPESAGLCGQSAPLPPPPPPAASIVTNAIVYAQGNLSLPSGLAYLPGTTAGSGHAWVSDHVLGLCRLDQPPVGIPTVDNAETIINQSTCVSNVSITSPGQTDFVLDPSDPTGNRGYLFVADNGAKGRGVWRLTYSVSNQTLSQPVLMTTGSSKPLPNGNRTSAVALRKDAAGNYSLYVVFLKNRDVYQISNPFGTSTSQLAVKIGQTADRKGPASIAIVNDDLYLAEAIGVSKINLAGSCAASSNCLAQLVSTVTAVVPAPIFVVADTAHSRLYVSDLSVVRRFMINSISTSRNPTLTYSDTKPYATGGKGLSSGPGDGSRAFLNISAMGVDATTGNLYVGDDLTAGVQLFTGRVFWEGYVE